LLLTVSFCELDSKIEGGTILFPRFLLMLFLPSTAVPLSIWHRQLLIG